MDPKYFIKNAEKLPSPSLIVFLPIVKRNIEHAIATVSGDLSKLRPHAKTHKTPEIAKLQLGHGITKHKCTTLREARMLAEVGAKDILIAYPIIGPNIAKLIELIAEFPQVDFKILADDPIALDQISDAMNSAKKRIKILLDLNVGMDRTGISVGESALSLYKKMAELDAIEPIGIHAYDGHIRESDPADRKKSCEFSLAQVSEMSDLLKQNRLPISTIVIGGTPTFPIYAEIDGVEASPGTFVFNDHGYSERYPDLGFEPAAILLTRVISKPLPNRFCLDLGHKAIAADPIGDRGKILNIPDAIVDSQSEEHWSINLKDRTTISVGDLVYIMPTHICPTVALHEFYFVIGENGEVIDRWFVTARNRS